MKKINKLTIVFAITTANVAKEMLYILPQLAL